MIRLTAFANQTVDPVIVGAAMLNRLHPELVYATAEDADLTRMIPGMRVPGACTISMAPTSSKK